jgi:diguanylate cyclase (GGDEF)-like protein
VGTDRVVLNAQLGAKASSERMTESKQRVLVERNEQARALTATLQLAQGVWGGVLSSMLDRIDGALGVKDGSSGRYAWASPRLNALAGRELEGLTDDDWLGADGAAPLRGADQSALVQTVPQVSEHRVERDGQRREFSVTRVPLAAADGSAPRYIACLWIELTAQRQVEAQLQLALQQLEQQQQTIEALRKEAQDPAVHDQVTGLYQRNQFDDQLRREVDLSLREHREFSLVSVALDPLNEAARQHGSEARNRILESLGRLLRSNTRAMDSSCRRGDDMFAVLLSGVGLATAHARMEGLRRQCATQIVMLNGHDLGFTVSMGVASFPHTAHTQDDLLHAADAALAEAQRRGGNHVTLASIRFDHG